MSARTRWGLTSYAPGVLVAVAGVILGVVYGSLVFVPFVVFGALLAATAHSQVFAYRAGYWRGRAEVVRELSETRTLRPVEAISEPAPWDEWDRASEATP